MTGSIDECAFLHFVWNCHHICTYKDDIKHSYRTGEIMEYGDDENVFARAVRIAKQVVNDYWDSEKS